MDYSFLYKHCYTDLDQFGNDNSWDLFISAINTSDRLTQAFSKAVSPRKYWILHEEYELEYSDSHADATVVPFPKSHSTSQNVRSFFENGELSDLLLNEQRICIDATGFMRPTLMFLILYLRQIAQVKKLDIIYSEPEKYLKNENTVFSKKIGSARSVEGFNLASQRDQSNDLLIIGAGFDDVLIAEVVESRKHAQTAQIIGFPSLKADMYQQNLYRIAQVGELDTADENSIWFAPANDPFETANTLSRIVRKKENETGRPVTNLYLSPLSTKAQTIGFALYFICECFGGKRDASVIIPESLTYSERTSQGISSIWKYELEFPD